MRVVIRQTGVSQGVALQGGVSQGKDPAAGSRRYALPLLPCWY